MYDRANRLCRLGVTWQFLKKEASCYQHQSFCDCNILSGRGVAPTGSLSRRHGSTFAAEVIKDNVPRLGKISWDGIVPDPLLTPCQTHVYMQMLSYMRAGGTRVRYGVESAVTRSRTARRAHHFT